MINVIDCILQLSNNVMRPLSSQFTLGFVDNMLDTARRKLRLNSHFPVEESVTFKMSCSQGSLPVIRNVHHGL